jgi:hypothetical protein
MGVLQLLVLEKNQCKSTRVGDLLCERRYRFEMGI